MTLIPTVLEKSGSHERAYDLYSRMLRERIIFATEQVEDRMSAIICAQLLFLESENSEEDIYLYVNSPGGVVTAGLAIIDTMNYIKPDVVTICMGQAASMGAMILSSGAKGKRYSLPSARIMCHQPSGGAQGMATDIQIAAEEILRIKEKLNTLLAINTGKSYEEVDRMMDRDRFFSTDQALEYGLIDRVIASHDDIPAATKAAK